MQRPAARIDACPRTRTHRLRHRRVQLALPMLVLALASAPAGAAAASGGVALDRAERAAIAGINRERADRGLRGVRVDQRLSRAADAHSQDMLARRYFGHDNLGGGSWTARVRRYLRAGAIGEVIGQLRQAGRARGPRAEAALLVRMWMNSPPHRAVLLSPRLGRLGAARRVARAGDLSLTVYTVDFASGR